MAASCACIIMMRRLKPGAAATSLKRSASKLQNVMSVTACTPNSAAPSMQVSRPTRSPGNKRCTTCRSPLSSDLYLMAQPEKSVNRRGRRLPCSMITSPAQARPWPTLKDSMSGRSGFPAGLDINGQLRHPRIFGSTTRVAICTTDMTHLAPDPGHHSARRHESTGASLRCWKKNQRNGLKCDRARDDFQWKKRNIRAHDCQHTTMDARPPPAREKHERKMYRAPFGLMRIRTRKWQEGLRRNMFCNSWRWTHKSGKHIRKASHPPSPRLMLIR